MKRSMRFFNSLLTMSLVLLFLSCATVPCGKVDTLDVYVKDGMLLSCQDALKATNEAYDLMWEQAAGPLNEPWRVEFTWGVDAYTWARTYPEEHLIQIDSSAPQSVLHELLHAYLFEVGTGRVSHHKLMCANPHWQQIEHEFGVKPYCHLAR